jgi:hypothetical protein
MITNKKTIAESITAETICKKIGNVKFSQRFITNKKTHKILINVYNFKPKF